MRAQKLKSPVVPAEVVFVTDSSIYEYQPLTEMAKLVVEAVKNLEVLENFLQVIYFFNFPILK